MSIKKLLIALGLAALSLGVQAGNRPDGYVTICNEGKTCNVPIRTTVAFGRAGQFHYRVMTGSFLCTEAYLGQRVPGGVNECSVLKSVLSSSSSSSSTSSSSSSSSGGGYRIVCGGPPSGYEFCAMSGGYCRFEGARQLVRSNVHTVYQGSFFTHLGTRFPAETVENGLSCSVYNHSGNDGNNNCARCYVQSQP